MHWPKLSVSVCPVVSSHLFYLHRCPTAVMELRRRRILSSWRTTHTSPRRSRVRCTASNLRCNSCRGVPLWAPLLSMLDPAKGRGAHRGTRLQAPCVNLYFILNSIGGHRWQMIMTQNNARIRSVPVRLNQGASTAALPVKAPVALSN